MNLYMYLLLIVSLLSRIFYAYRIVNKIISRDTRQYSLNGYNLTINTTNIQLNAAVRYRLIEIYFDIYPRLIERFNKNAPRSVHLYIDNNSKYAFWGSAVNRTIIINANDLSHPLLFSRYYDIFVHELAHLVQQYTTRNLIDVQWLGEGLADYIRYKYLQSNIDANWPLIDYSIEQNFNDSYKITARFLLWLESKYNSSIIECLDKSLRDATYNQNITWNYLTGKSIEQLWVDYSKEPNLFNNCNCLFQKTSRN